MEGVVSSPIRWCSSSPHSLFFLHLQSIFSSICSLSLSLFFVLFAFNNLPLTSFKRLKKEREEKKRCNVKWKRSGLARDWGGVKRLVDWTRGPSTHTRPTRATNERAPRVRYVVTFASPPYLTLMSSTIMHHVKVLLYSQHMFSVFYVFFDDANARVLLLSTLLARESSTTIRERIPDFLGTQEDLWCSRGSSIVL